MKDIGITSNTRIIIGESIEETDSENESETSIQGEELEENNQDELNDLEELEQRRPSVFHNLLPAKRVTVHRETLVEDVMDAYRKDTSFIHHKIDVTFKEENAIDLQGLTREMFTTFFNLIFLKFFFGRNEKAPCFDIKILFNGTFEIIGKIISHCFVLTNYLPPKLSKAIYSIILTKDCRDETFLHSYFNVVSEDEEMLIKNAMNCTKITEDIKCKLYNLVDDYGGCEPINHQNDVKPVVLSLAKASLYARPLLSISNLKKGMWCYSILWNNVTLKILEEYLQKLRPSIDKVLSIISCQFTDDQTNRTQEERILNYMEQYIRSLSEKELATLLKF